MATILSSILKPSGVDAASCNSKHFQLQMPSYKLFYRVKIKIKIGWLCGLNMSPFVCYFNDSILHYNQVYMTLNIFFKMIIGYSVHRFYVFTCFPNFSTGDNKVFIGFIYVVHLYIFGLSWCVEN